MFEVVRDRPLLQIALAMVGGAAAFDEFSVAGIAFVSLIWFFLRRFDKWSWALAVFFVSGWGLAFAEEVRNAKNGTVVEGVVEMGPAVTEHGYDIVVENYEGELSGLSIPANVRVAYGDTIRATGTTATGRVLHRHGVAIPMRRANDLVRLAESHSAVAFLQRGREAIDSLLDRTSHGQLASAIMFGEARRMPYETREDLRRAGVYHICVTAGLHVGIVGGLFLWLLGFARAARVVQILLTIIILFSYALMAGATPPSMRAAVSIGLYLLAGLVRRQPDALTALAGGAIYQVLRDPGEIGGASFVLSYLTVSCLILWMPLVSQWASKRLPKKRERLLTQLRYGLSNLVGIGVLVSLATAPLLAYYFGEIPVLGIGANLLIVPLLAPALWVAWIGALLWFVPGWLTLWHGAVLDTLLYAISILGHWIGSQPWATIAVLPFSPWWLVAIYVPVLGLAKEWPREVD